ncbi:MAG: 5'/3'-nucleotidase SurE [Candidatus Omnitrophica bacterium]|nr:5'/3'-nucleotidase SurE [Candidatus Omnitrophota bacterium]
MKKPCVLVTNDDGITAPGLIALEKILSPFCDCRVICPITECSSVGQSVTLRKHIEVFKFQRPGTRTAYGIDGTPADCVKFAIAELFGSRKPVLAVSGINHGANTGISVYYSGTIAGAREALIGGIPSVAFSVTSHQPKNFVFAANIVKQIVMNCLKHGLPQNTLLNVNIPALSASKIKGIKVLPQADSKFVEKFVKEGEEPGKLKYRLTGEIFINDRSIETDEEALKKGWVAVTPLQLDLTRYDFMKELSKRLETGKKRHNKKLFQKG